MGAVSATAGWAWQTMLTFGTDGGATLLDAAGARKNTTASVRRDFSFLRRQFEAGDGRDLNLSLVHMI